MQTAVTVRILGLVHELCLKRIHVTKRDLFYTDVKLFEEQGQSDSVLDDMACMLGCTRSSLHGEQALHACICMVSRRCMHASATEVLLCRRCRNKLGGSVQCAVSTYLL